MDDVSSQFQHRPHYAAGSKGTVLCLNMIDILVSVLPPSSCRVKLWKDDSDGSSHTLLAQFMACGVLWKCADSHWFARVGWMMTGVATEMATLNVFFKAACAVDGGGEAM